MVSLALVFVYLNRGKKKTPAFVYDFEDFTSNLNDLEKEFWLLLSLYRDQSIPVDTLACNVAYQHSHNMAVNGEVSHANFPERSNLLTAQGCYSVSEIVGAASSVNSVFDKFKASGKHDEKLLDLFYNACGISIIQNYGVLYVTVLFIRI